MKGLEGSIEVTDAVPGGVARQLSADSSFHEVGPSLAMNRRKILYGLLALPSCLAACERKAEAPSAPTTPVAPATIVGGILDAPDNQLDYLRTKLAFDKIVDDTADLESITGSISQMAAFAAQMAGANADDARKLAAVRTVIYRAGPWNESRPFAYDLADPYGQNLSSKLLSSYLSTRLGNCVSMPVLFLILADRLRVNVALSTAPLHVFVKFTDASDKATNLETTSGALPARDQWYREKLPMTDLSVASGLYLRTLSRKESVALMATTVMEHLMDQERYQDAIDVADVILAHSPRDAQTMVRRGSAFAHLLEEEFYKPYPSADLVPPYLHGRYQQLENANRQAFVRAEALGWTPTEIPSAA